MKKRIFTAALAALQIAVLCFIYPATATAEPAALSVGVDNSLLMPTYYAAETDSYNDSPDWLSTAIINEIRLDTATAEGTLTAATEVLDYYENLGINCLWVTPVNETDCDNGYTNYGLHTIDLELTEADTYEEGWQNFAKFVEAAHSRNIRILLDVIIWGVDYDAPMVDDSAYSGVVSSNENKWGGWSYNWETTAFNEYYTNTMLDIIETTNIDGIRVDLAPGVSGCSELLGDIRQKAYNNGHSIVIMSEENSNDRTGGTGSRVYDLEQVGVLDYVNKDYWSDEFMTDNGFDSNSSNWVINVYGPPDWWLRTESGRDIVSTTKSGSIYAGSKSEQMDTYYGFLNKEIETGKNQYYTYAVSFHDLAAGKGDSVLSYGYSSIFAPVIPLWMAGDEAGSVHGQGTGNNLYFNSMVNTDLPAADGQAEFYSKLKKYIEIRRTYNDIFSYFPENHRNTNICAVSVSGIDTYQAYARYANGKAVLIVPNGTDSAADITVTIPVSDVGLGGSYTVKNLMTDEVISASDNTFTVNVEAGDMAVILVDDGSTVTTGCEATVQANTEARREYSLTAAGKTEELIAKIGDVTIYSKEEIEAARAAFDTLSATEQLKVRGAETLKKAEKKYAAIVANGNDSRFAGIITEGDMYPNTSTYTKWGWSSVVEALGETGDGGYNINYASTTDSSGKTVGWAKDYRFEIMRPIKLDGASMQITIDTSGAYYSKMFFLKISPKHSDTSETGNIGIKFDVGGGQVFFRTNNTACDHSAMSGYNSGIATDRIFTTLGGTITLSFTYASDGGLIININGTDYKITAEDFSEAYGVKSAENVLFYVSPCDSSYPDLTVDYLTEKAETVIDSCDDYVVASAEMSPDFTGGYSSWASSISRTDTAEGLRVEYSETSNFSSAYRLWTKNTYNMDGLHMKLTLEDTSYNDRLFFLTFTNSNNNTDNGLRIKIDANNINASGCGQIFAELQGKGTVSTVGMVNASTYTDRVWDKAFLSDTFEILMLKQSDGGFILNINGYEFPLTAEQMTGITSLTDTEKVHVGISACGSYPDYTLNYLHSGDDLCYSCEAGDVNCDHRIDVLDYIRMKKNLSTNTDIYSADLNSDSLYNSTDLVLLKKKLLGIDI